ncbi:MAG TPA: SDR family NAD(P)-dependent oxidoreductase [Gemmatimonadaceae bacterium]
MTDETIELSPLKRAFLAVQTLQDRVAELERGVAEPIAIVGLSCRFPGAANAARFWELLRDGVDAVSETNPQRWADAGATIHSDDEASATRWAGYLPSIDTFDPQFFGIAPREAAGMDPQQRLFLEVCWEALEDAGIAPDRLKGSATGVYVGLSTNDYPMMQVRGGDLSHLGMHYASGIAHSIVSGRVSYLLGLSGPSVSIDTACSSSLVAVHLACQSLRSGETDLAIAGGVNAIVLPDNAIAFSRSGMLSPDGRCKTFDARANGFVRGEGCGVVVVKRLSTAMADGDLIHAVIRGSAINQDGASSGMTAPSGPAQEAAIRGALRVANAQPRDVQWIETHGTGTSLGDPIEVQAIGGALGGDRQPDENVLITSVKSNIGHLEASAGIAGLIKVVLSLRNSAIPKSLHFETPNPLIPWERLPVRVVTELTPWTTPESGSRLAGVSSFGFSGTNAHILLGDAPAVATPTAIATDRSRHVLAWSAPTASALRLLAREYANQLVAHPEQSLADVVYSANVGRAQFRHRAALPFAIDDDVAGRLRAFGDAGSANGVVAGQMLGSEPPRVVFMFTGQGSQYVGMGRQLYETQPVFRKTLDECDAIVGDAIQPRVLDVLFPRDGQPSPIDDTSYTQPVLFALEYSLAALWQSWGVKPAAVVGHSLGEIVAATVAGVLRLDDALRLVVERGRLGQHALARGAMGAVMAPAPQVAEILASLGSNISVAAYNGPANTVISGPQDAVAAAFDAFRARGINVKPLTSSSSFHSAAADAMLPEFREVASKIAYSTQRIPVYSNLSGRRAAAGEMSSAEYWVKHVREPVQFAASFAALLADGFTTFLEVGPHTTLLGLGRACAPESACAWLPSLRREHDESTILFGSLAQLYARGVSIDWTAFDADRGRRRVRLPTYPFERQRYWATPGASSSRSSRAGAVHPLLDRRLTSAFLTDRVFESELSLESTPWLGEHRVLGAAVLPTTAYLEAAWAAATELHGDAVASLEDFEIFDALVTPESGSVTMQLAIAKPDGDRALLRVASAESSSDENGNDSSSGWRSHAAATVVLGGASATSGESLATVRARCTNELSPEALRERVLARSIEHGASFQGLREVRAGNREAIGFAELPDVVTDDVSKYFAYPSLLDAALQVLQAAIFDDAVLGSSDAAYLPVGIDRFTIRGRLGRALWSHVAILPSTTTNTMVADARVFDATGNVVAEFAGLRLRRVEAAAWASTDASDPIAGQLYDIEWTPIPAANGDVVATWAAPDPRAIAAEIIARVDAVASANRMPQYRSHLPELDVISREFVAEAFRTLGWRPSISDRVTTAELADRFGVVPMYRQLLARFLEILAEDGVLRRDGDAWIVQEPLHEPATSPVAQLESLRARFTDGAGPVGLVARTGPELAACLDGRTDPLSLLFPGGSFAEADDLYRYSPGALTANSLARQAVERFVAAAPSAQPIRVLEIGAGTGGTTSFVLPAFDPANTKYVFTDMSPLFLMRAKERNAAFPFVDYRLFDVEKDPVQQGMANGSFDLIIAANVLHATKDLSETLAHVRQLLRPGGMLVMIEVATRQRWIDLTFGLTEGWWRFTDRELRPDYPLIDRGAWAKTLVAAGFELPSAADIESSGGEFDDNILIVSRAVATAAERWIVLADDSGVSAGLAQVLRSSGRDVVTVTPGATFTESNGHVSLAPTDPAGYDALLESASESSRQSIAGVVHAWSLNANASDVASTDELHAAERIGCESLLYLTQAMAKHASSASASLVVVTCGAQPAQTHEVTLPLHASMWGLAKAIRLELPDVDCRCIDLDPAHDTPATELVGRILARGETQTAVRDGEWTAARLVRHAKKTDSGAPLDLVNATPGVLDGIRFVPAGDRPLAATDVRIRVQASALNFRDVLIAMGMYPGATANERLGGECAGRIIQVGSAVTRFNVGDDVVAMAPGGLGSVVDANAELTFTRPPDIRVEDIVTMPAVFMTSWHSLYDLAQLKTGERVLIHAGAGGVGLSAIQLAKRVGAEIFATAGSPAKREYLASLGVQHVMDSRATKYVDEIMRATNGHGVDVVLNSLTDAHIPSSISVLAPEGGRFIELGKRGIWTDEQFAAVRPGAEYYVVDLAAVGNEQPQVVGDLLRRVRAALVAGQIQPLPRRIFSSDDVISAFRFMAQAKHIGKIVIRRTDAIDASVVRSDGGYLITGGLGGLGLAVTDNLLARGAGQVVLMGRSDPSASVQARIDAWNVERRRVSFARGDVGREADVQRALTAVASTGAVLRGVIHSAGVLHDAVLVGQTWSNFAETFGPKVDGSWNLHRLTAGASLDFFVLFSSISSVLGSPGQSNHSAANAFMDALAYYRRGRGLPGLSINWGAWAEIGAAIDRGVAERIAAQGMSTIAPHDGIDMLERLMRDGATQSAAMPVDWTKFAREFAGGRLRGSFLERVSTVSVPAAARRASVAGTSATSTNGTTPVSASFVSIRDAAPATRWTVLIDAMRTLASRVLGLESNSSLDVNRPLSEMGLDSLMAVELRNMMKKELGLERAVAATIVFDYPTVSALAEYVGETVFGWPSRKTQPSSGGPTLSAVGADSLRVSSDADGMDLLDRLETLSPEQVDQLLARHMDSGEVSQ